METMNTADIKKLNIFERMALITAELEPLSKDLTVGKGDKAYKAASEGSVLAAIKPLEEKYRVFSYAADRQQTSAILEREYFWNGEHRKVRLMKVDVTETYRFVNIDNPTEHVETVSFGTGIDTFDKAPGKAMTYADKYAIMKAYKMSTGAANDPDACASPEPDFMSVLADVPDANNPLDFSPREDLKNNGGVAPRNASDEPQSAESPAEHGMTLEKAQTLILPIGEHRGKSMGELFAINPGLVAFYAGEKFRNDKYSDLKVAAQVIMANMSSRR